VLERPLYGRAKMEVVPAGVRVSGFGPSPESFVRQIADDVERVVEDTWENLAVHHAVPCPTADCEAVFPLARLFGFAGAVLSCNSCWQSHDPQTLIAPHRAIRPELAEVVELVDRRFDAVEVSIQMLSDRLVVPEALLREIETRLVPAFASGELFSRLDSIDDNLARIVAQANEHLLVLLRNSDDLAARGPRIITATVEDPHLLKKAWKTARITFHLWCEHSNRRLDELTGNAKVGVYTVEVTRESLKKLVPLASLITRLLVGVAPLGVLAAEHNLNTETFKQVQDELNVGKASLDATKAALAVGEDQLDTGDEFGYSNAISVADIKIAQEHISATDPRFGGLVPVRHRQTHVRHWVHDIYANLPEYDRID